MPGGEQTLGRKPSCGILRCGCGARGAAVVGWTGLDGRVSLLRVLLIGFDYQQTIHEIRWKNCQRYCHAVLMINETNYTYSNPNPIRCCQALCESQAACRWLATLRWTCRHCRPMNVIPHTGPFQETKESSKIWLYLDESLISNFNTRTTVCVNWRKYNLQSSHLQSYLSQKSEKFQQLFI